MPFGYSFLKAAILCHGSQKLLHVAGVLKDVADKAAERHLQRKRKAGQMPISPFTSPKAARRPSPEGENAGKASIAARKAAMQSPQSSGHLASATASGSAAEAATTAGNESKQAAAGQFPGGPLFASHSPVSKGLVGEWVKEYLAMNPRSNEEEARKGSANQHHNNHVVMLSCCHATPYCTT